MANISMERFQEIVNEVSNQDGTTLEYRTGACCLATLLLIELQKSEDKSSENEHKGYWKGKQQGRWIYAQCSECDTVHDAPSNFCPSCGVKMISKELKMPVENMIRFNGMVNGCPAFIGTQELEFNKERAIEERLDNNEGIAFIRLANLDGFATYGIEQTKDYDFGHGPGYIWASRATVMNKIFDVALIDVLYKTENSSTYSCCAIDLVHLIDLLEDTEYCVDPECRVSGEDIYYDVKKRI